MQRGARLEIVYTGNRIEGSNPSLCANKRSTQFGCFFCYMNWKGFERRV